MTICEAISWVKKKKKDKRWREESIWGSQFLNDSLISVWLGMRLPTFRFEGTFMRQRSPGKTAKSCCILTFYSAFTKRHNSDLTCCSVHARWLDGGDVLPGIDQARQFYFLSQGCLFTSWFTFTSAAARPREPWCHTFCGFIVLPIYIETPSGAFSKISTVEGVFTLVCFQTPKMQL